MSFMGASQTWTLKFSLTHPYKGWQRRTLLVKSCTSEIQKILKNQRGTPTGPYSISESRTKSYSVIFVRKKLRSASALPTLVLKPK